MKIWISIISLFVLSSCSNRTIGGLKQGFWKQKDTTNGIVHESKGRYCDGLPTGKWKYKTNGKLVKKEHYKGEDCFVQFFGSNGKIERSGNAKLAVEGRDLHWFYVGDWLTYDAFGRVIFVDTYYRGELVGEKEIQTFETKKAN